ncbi:hypothetical protein NDU88_009541 [Pleurodeles waltl]|uniref:Uncharacterized protein n=1 Tax=Pleurodeles waltl TaxID=8319 RepID=A0AAV7PSD3_PLEWA|nr:hypothetical protein NDU88_009541 [Pleurodeles waltl]
MRSVGVKGNCLELSIIWHSVPFYTDPRTVGVRLPGGSGEKKRVRLKQRVYPRTVGVRLPGGSGDEKRVRLKQRICQFQFWKLTSACPMVSLHYAALCFRGCESSLSRDRNTDMCSHGTAYGCDEKSLDRSLSLKKRKKAST